MVTSFTVITCCAVDELPAQSVTVNVRVMVKRFSQVLLEITSECVFVIVEAQSSVAITNARLTAVSLAHDTEAFAGLLVITGAVLLSTVYVYTQSCVLPSQSV